MNSIYTAKAISTKNRFAGRDWYYNFRELNDRFDETSIEKVADALLVRYSRLTKNWDEDKNSEWLCRTYLSAKMIMTATLQLNAMEFSQERNMRLVVPYLTYYSLLSLMRSIVYMSPDIDWNNGQLVSISHKKAINLTFDHIGKFDQGVARELKEISLKSKAYRELISYRSPSSGDKNIGSLGDIVSISTLLCEVAQFNSELLEASILKNVSQDKFVFLDSYIHDLALNEIEGESFFDQEDLYRLDYLKRRYPASPNILHSMTEGHVEDFFGAWISEDPQDTEFDPDSDWQLIFDIP